ncbi:GlsB/YeaQ/YmgE family stress response membrane protein [Propionibacteriaceae bacterium Y1700]|uniref:GlsB/YeaQ/YmgE family stress response membrane protein n=1 Tax=Microlunatus sp. Y1700 TaxID=3418487 RepID=UPI003DA6F23A
MSTHPMEEQYSAILPTLDSVLKPLRDGMNQGLTFLATLPIPGSLVQPWVDKWNDSVSRIDGARTEIDTLGPQVTATCRRLMDLREAGEEWKGAIAADRAYPFAQSLSREALEGTHRFSWSSNAVSDYWTHIAGNENTATELAGFCDSLGDSLISLADAIDKQNTDLAWAITGFVASILTLGGAGIGVAIAIGAVSGALAGAPFAGVGAIPGAVLGGLIAAIIAVVGAIVGLIFSIKAWVDASKVIADAGVAELDRLNTSIRALQADAWPAPHGFGAGSDYQE